MKATLTLLISCGLLVACSTAMARTVKPIATAQTAKPAIATTQNITSSVGSIASIAPEPRSVPETHAHATESALETSAAIIYQRNGGAINRKNVWLIYLDGRVVYNGGTERHASSAAVANLLSQIEATGFFDMPDRYEGRGCNACSLYRVTVRRGGQVKAVEGETLKPANLDPAFGLVIDEISRFLSSLP